MYRLYSALVGVLAGFLLGRVLWWWWEQVDLGE